METFKQIHTAALADLLAASNDGIIRQYGHSVYKGKRALQIYTRQQAGVLSFNPGAVAAADDTWADYIFNYVCG